MPLSRVMRYTKTPKFTVQSSRVKLSSINLVLDLDLVWPGDEA